MPTGSKVLKPGITDNTTVGDALQGISSEKIRHLIEAYPVDDPSTLSAIDMEKRELWARSVLEVLEDENTSFSDGEAFLKAMIRLRRAHPYDPTPRFGRNPDGFLESAAVAFILHFKFSHQEACEVLWRDLKPLFRDSFSDPRKSFTSDFLPETFGEPLAISEHVLPQALQGLISKSIYGYHRLDNVVVNAENLFPILFALKFLSKIVEERRLDSLKRFELAFFDFDGFSFYEEEQTGFIIANVNRYSQKWKLGFIKYIFDNADVEKITLLIYTIRCLVEDFLWQNEIKNKLAQKINKRKLPKSGSTQNDLGILNAFLDTKNVPESEREGLIKRLEIDIARATRPKWVGRLERGGELATLSAPQFLKRVHKEEFAPDGTVSKEIIRAIDPDLMNAVEDYISKATKRGTGLKDAEGLRFTLARPKSRAKAKLLDKQPSA